MYWYNQEFKKGNNMRNKKITELRQIPTSKPEEFYDLLNCRPESTEHGVSYDNNHKVHLSITWINKALNLGYAIGITKTEPKEIRHYKIGSSLVWQTYLSTIKKN